MDHETFALANYQFILYGMEFPTALDADRGRYPDMPRARQEFMRVQDAGRRAVASLPAHRELLHRVNQAGFRFAEQPVRPAHTVLMR